jgi:long-subunit acyl-CoA synthetase (AMP-forming)
MELELSGDDRRIFLTSGTTGVPKGVAATRVWLTQAGAIPLR